MIELLVLSVCFAGSGNGCEAIGKQYYKHKRLDIMVKAYTRRHQEEIQFMSAVAMLTSKKVILPIYKSNGQQVNVTISSEPAVVYRWDF